MAVLEKIRKRTVFLILVIGLALFAFVISGIFSRNTTPDQLVIGSVMGMISPIVSSLLKWRTPPATWGEA